LDSLRKIKKIARLSFSLLQSKVALLWLEYSSCSNANQGLFRIHLLVVKQEKYVPISRICVISFLYFHPNSEVFLHADRHTLPLLKKWKLRKKHANSIKFIEIMDSENKTWQDLKLQLIYQLSGTSDIFIDADLKWNGPLEEFMLKDRYVYFFVEEYKLTENPTFMKMLSQQEFSDYRDSSMWNTSFVCLSGFTIRTEQIEEVNLLQEQILSYSRKFIENKTEVNSVIRISEQLAISLAASKWEKKIKALKAKDGYKDGSFLESSYFGATGTHF
jgi:hypothetical protein